MKTFLTNLGLSGFEADKLIEKHGEKILSMLETPSGRKRLGKTVSPEAVDTAYMQYVRITNGELFDLLEPFGVPREKAFKLLKSRESSQEAVDMVRNDPYGIVFTIEAPFPAAENLAKSLDVHDPEQRVKAAVYSSLTLAEKGVDEADDSPLGELLSDIAGSMCLPMSLLVKVCSVLLGKDADEEWIRKAAFRLHRERLILLTRQDDTIYAHKNKAAYMELFSARNLRERLDIGTVQYGTNPFEAIDQAQASLGMYLSYEQVNAVHSAITNHISIITGGPGTGKSATTKVLLEAFRLLAGDDAKITLLAPTGQAARRLSQATGRPASTIHSALKITPANDDPRLGEDLDADLIIVDETSMVDASVLSTLLRHSKKDGIIVFVGDPNQLPSVGVGEVLTQLILCLPVARLTKIFRQKDGSDVAHNAARVSVGTTQMIESDKFYFIECSGSEAIAEATCNEYKRLVAEHGADRVIVLTPFRRHTPTCVNELNTVLRKAVSDGKKHNFISVGGVRIYEGDKVLFLKNKFGLVNGDVGYVVKTWRGGCECKFGETSVKLSGSELSWIVPAYSQTVHKSQGMEYPIVLIVSDKAHARMATRPIFFTALTRAKDQVVIVGEKEVFEDAVRTTPKHRYSRLANLVNNN